MFEPTIKYKRVNDPPKDITKSLDELTIAATEIDKKVISSTNDDSTISTNDQEKQAEPIKDISNEKPTDPSPEEKFQTATEPVKMEPDYTFEEEEEEECKIEVDPNDKERIIVTLSTGKQFSADRYCPHAGADLSYHGKVSEHDYPPEIGPILMCPIHYWEFALEKDGKGGGGWATINACPVDVAEKCASSAEKKKLDW